MKFIFELIISLEVKMANNNITIYMYHGVGIPNPMWRWNYLTCPYQVFEKQLKALRRLNYYTPTLDEIYDHINGIKLLPKKSVVLTFDDGYCDNYIFAYPLMKKYGFRGTIFVNVDFVDPRPIKRKKLGEDKIENLEKSGFLSWDEMREMEMEGVMDIQNHAKSHTWYPISDEIVDFRHPGDEYAWLTWNNNIQKKPYLQIDDKNLVSYGEPVYKNEKSLSSKRFFPDEKLKDYLIEIVKKKEIDFFSRPDWRNNLLGQVEKFKTENDMDQRYENDDEHLNRFVEEIVLSRKVLEDNLNKKVNYLCWPGNGISPLALKIAQEDGYKLMTTASDISRDERRKLKNTPNYKSNRLGRISPVFFHDGKETFNSKIVYANGFWFVFKIKSFISGKYLSFLLHRINNISRRLYKLYLKGKNEL